MRQAQILHAGILRGEGEKKKKRNSEGNVTKIHLLTKEKELYFITLDS